MDAGPAGLSASLFLAHYHGFLPSERKPINLFLRQTSGIELAFLTKLEEAAREQRKPTDRLAEKIASFCGRMTFVWVHVVWFGGWILLNLVPGVPHVDPFPLLPHAHRFTGSNLSLYFYSHQSKSRQSH